MLETFIATLKSITILLGIGILGFVLISRKILADNVLQSLSRLALEVALPCLIFSKIMNQFSQPDFPGWWLMPLWYCGFTAVSGLLAAAFTPLIGRSGERREVCMALLYQNALFVPLIVIAEVYGYESDRLVVLFFFTLLFSPFFFGTAPFFFAKPTLRNLPWSKVANPVVIATLAGLVIQLSGMGRGVPDFAISAASMVGNMSAPLLLIILGGSIYLDLQDDGAIRWATILRFMIVKNIAFPLIAIVFVYWLRPPAHVAYLLILQSAVPPVTSLPIVVKRGGGQRKLVNQLLVGSFAAALVTIPASMAVFGWLYPP